MSKNYGLTGIASDAQLGKGGPRVKNDSGVVQHRNSVDSAFARTQGATPVVGDDLTTKDYVDGKLGALPSLDTYDSAGGGSVTVAPAWSDIAFDTNRQIDTAQFTHVTSPASPDFTWVGVSGTKVLVIGRITVSPPGQATVRGRIMINTGAAFTEVAGSRASTEISTSTGEGEVVVFAILTLNNGDRVKIQAQHTNITASATTIANSSGIQAFALEAPASGTGNTFDNRGSPITSPAAAPAGTADFTVPLGLPSGSATWFKLVSVTGSVGGNIKIYSDVARTKLIYEANFTTTEHIEGTPWSSIADDATDLESDTLYCTVRNDGSLTSTYTMQMQFKG